MNPKELDQLFRNHSQLTGASAGNLDAWLMDGAAARRYSDLIPEPASGEQHFVEIGCYQPTVCYYWHLGWKNVTGFFKDDGEGTIETKYQDKEGNQATLIRLDAENTALPLADGSADVVVMMEVFEHFGIDPMYALWEVNRVLKPGGRFIFSTPNAASWPHAIRAIRGLAPIMGLEYSGYSTNRHNRLYDVTEMRVILEKAGFQISTAISKSYFTHTTDRTGKVLHGLLNIYDWITRFMTGFKPERENYLVLKTTKVSQPLERYPIGLYFNPQEWPGIIEERAVRDAQLKALSPKSTAELKLAP